jgi:hypothetical protein
MQGAGHFIGEAVNQPTIDAIQLKAKWELALINRVHMKIGQQGLDALVALAGGATQPQANARAEALRAALIAHMALVGTFNTDGEHLAADAANSATLAAIPAATTLGTCITLITGLQAADVAHANAAGVHFHDDATLLASTITVVPPVTLANCITDLNDLLVNMLAHLNRGSF